MPTAHGGRYKALLRASNLPESWSQYSPQQILRSRRHVDDDDGDRVAHFACRVAHTWSSQGHRKKTLSPSDGNVALTLLSRTNLNMSLPVETTGKHGLFNCPPSNLLKYCSSAFRLSNGERGQSIVQARDQSQTSSTDNSFTEARRYRCWPSVRHLWPGRHYSIVQNQSKQIFC